MAHRIYLVDDDHFLLNLYGAKFKSAGEEVSTFGGGEELLNELRKDKVEGRPMPDAILVDLIMPGMDGFALLESLKKEQLGGSAKLIILSNEGADAEIERARALGIDGYIIKASAIPSEVLAEVVRTIGAAPNHPAAVPNTPST